MVKIEFWNLVNTTARGVGVNRSRQVDRIRNILEQGSLEDIASFKKRQNSEMKSACTFGLMVATFVVHSTLSDDLFLNFRSWLILHGEDVFHEAIKNPDSVVNLCKKREVDRISEAGFFDLPLGLWLDRGGGAAEYAKKVGVFQEKAIKTRWPANVSEFEQRYPVLFKAFWNAGRIKSFHR